MVVGRRILLACLWGVLTLSVARAVYASDCPPDDPSRADCASAASVARNPLVPIAGAGLGLVLVTVVNGVVVSRREVPAAEPVPAGATTEGQEPTRYTLDVQTPGARTRLDTDGEDTLIITAVVRCSRAGMNTEAMTRALAFAVEGP